MWKDVIGYEGHYIVNELGSVKSVKFKKCVILKPYTTRLGYTINTLSKSGYVERRSTHRIVAESFISNSENKPQVNHIDGNKSNNSVNNLEWCTISENRKHAYNSGLQRGPVGEKNGNCKLNKEDVLHLICIYENKELLSKNCNIKITYRLLSNMFGVGCTTIENIVKRRSWKSIK